MMQANARPKALVPPPTHRIRAAAPAAPRLQSVKQALAMLSQLSKIFHNSD